MLGNCSCFCLCRLLTFFKIIVFKKFFQEHYGLDLDQDRRSVGTVLGPECLQRLSADNKSRFQQGKS